ncbi:hypothetical protein PM033_14840 [Halorubrum ezzemoulense]|uniref:hypothetical protein n=1 Tax=Halorubrum ezzemoulense TaxID=337243 RepID=UPI00232D8AE5|nr:hypothetical protein [Halorubrum ezzemoulense]MDB2253022.1 hypothetical protein [Halorubrum ezzemoulense]
MSTRSPLSRPHCHGKPSFSDFGDIEEFFEESPWTVEDEKDFEEIPEDEFDAYVEDTTMFATWESMLGKAGKNGCQTNLGYRL